MRVLVLGGTIFLGRHLVQAALAAGHQVTLFNRGRSPNPFPGIEVLIGDRDGGLDALRGRDFDVVVDTSGYLPRLVRASVDLELGRYCFVSTVSVYAGRHLPSWDESSPVIELEDPTSEDVNALYGALKASCEEEVPADGLIVRPGLIAGPQDPTGRFTYWPARAARGGETLAPGSPRQPCQLIDVRDLAAWMVSALGRGLAGTYNVAGPVRPLAETLERVAEGVEAGWEPTWVPDEFLLARGVRPYTDLPLWIPATAGFAVTDCTRAEADGLRCRPLEETARDTLAWSGSIPAAPQPSPGGPRRPPAGLSPERERELLDAWHWSNR